MCGPERKLYLQLFLHFRKESIKASKHYENLLYMMKK